MEKSPGILQASKITHSMNVTQCLCSPLPLNHLCCNPLTQSDGLGVLEKVYGNGHYEKTMHKFQIFYIKVNLSFNSIIHELFEVDLY